MKAGWLKGSLTNYRNTDALDAVLGTARNTLMCPDVSSALFPILRGAAQTLYKRVRTFGPYFLQGIDKRRFHGMSVSN